jgi:hypothetical protein
MFRTDVKIKNLTIKRAWKLPTSTQLRATWHTDSLYMAVPLSGASRYHNCCIDGGISPEYFGHPLVRRCIFTRLQAVTPRGPYIGNNHSEFLKFRSRNGVSALQQHWLLQLVNVKSYFGWNANQLWGVDKEGNKTASHLIWGNYLTLCPDLQPPIFTSSPPLV